MYYYEFIENYWSNNVFSPKVKGEIIAGSNGLYLETETVFRNAAHWMLISNEIKSKNSEVNKFISDTLEFFIINEPKNGTYLARESSKDKSNGLIGSAWIVESLSVFTESNYILRDKISKLITQLLLRYPFDHNKGVWKNVVEPDGRLLNIDRTFNHQLWMCMAHYDLLRFTNDTELQKRADTFCNKLPQNLKLNRNGVVYHTLGLYPHYHRTLMKRLINHQYFKEMNMKEWGYHGFNLLALAKIHRSTGSILVKKILNKLVKPVKKDLFWENQLNNRFGTTYNPVGIEVAVALDVLGEPLESICSALNFHFKQCFDTKSFSFINSKDDPTLNARLYEITYLSEKTKKNIKYDILTNKWYVNK